MEWVKRLMKIGLLKWYVGGVCQLWKRWTDFVNECLKKKLDAGCWASEENGVC